MSEGYHYDLLSGEVTSAQERRERVIKSLSFNEIVEALEGFMAGLGLDDSDDSIDIYMGLETALTGLKYIQTNYHLKG